jgi:hypothetical protein
MAKQTIAGQAGGYRKPGNPAAVSGPGGLSKRTDGTPAIGSAGGEDYGEAQALKDLQRAAPTQSRSAGGGGGGAAAPVSTPPPMGFDAPGDDSPVTSGAALGEGPGSEALGLDPDEETRNMSEGMIQLMVSAAQRPNASPSFRRLVRRALVARM